MDSIDEYVKLKYYLSKCIIIHTDTKYDLSSKKEIIMLKIIIYKLSYILPKEYFIYISKKIKFFLKNTFSLDEYIHIKNKITGLEFLTNSLIIKYIDNQYKFKDVSYIKYSPDYKIHLDYFSIVPIFYYYRKNIVEVILPNTLTIIPVMSFYNCVNLKKIVIPDSVISIENTSFNGCIKLDEIVFSKNLKHIKSFAFYRCFKLKDLTFPSSLETIDEHAFKKCYRLKTVNFSSCLEYIDKNSFSDCFKLRTINTYNKLNLNLKNHRLKINYI